MTIKTMSALLIHEDEVTHGDPVACNDDFCGDNYQSYLEGVDFFAGHTYYIVVDGYGDDCGNYELTVAEVGWECVYCPPETIMEGEPDCHDDYDDNYNGGCSPMPPVFQVLEPSDEPIHVCGKSGNFLTTGIEEPGPGVTRALRLSRPMPNPSTIATSLSFELEAAQAVTARICDPTGRVVRLR